MSADRSLTELYRRLARALAGLSWYVFGARAAIAYGSTRATVDVDVTVDAQGLDADILRQRLAAHGFCPRIDDWRELLDETRVLLLADRETATEVDLVLAGPGLEQEFLQRARPMLLANVTVPVIGAEDLVAVKLLAGRPQDLQDVDAVLRRAPAFDPERTRDVLRRIEQALDRSDLSSQFEALLTHRGPG